MPNDVRTCTHLIQTLENGKLGFEQAAARLSENGRIDVAQQFTQFSTERARMAAELQRIAASYGEETEIRGTVPGALHRGWIAVKDALTGDDPQAIINSAKAGEEHALEQFEEALTDEDISPELKATLTRHMAEVRKAHDYVVSMADDSAATTRR